MCLLSTNRFPSKQILRYKMCSRFLEYSKSVKLFCVPSFFGVLWLVAQNTGMSHVDWEELLFSAQSCFIYHIQHWQIKLKQNPVLWLMHKLWFRSPNIKCKPDFGASIKTFYLLPRSNSAGGFALEVLVGLFVVRVQFSWSVCECCFLNKDVRSMIVKVNAWPFPNCSNERFINQQCSLFLYFQFSL